MTDQKPSVGRVVHYVSYGTPGGEYTQECRAAIITELTGDPDHPDQVGLAVLNPSGQFFNRAIPYHDGGETPGDPNCTELHGQPFRYCPRKGCGWAEARPRPGSWHWPERA